MTRLQILQASAAVFASIVATSAVGQERLYAPAASCAKINAAVQSEGAIVISTSRHTYDRYVSNGSFCYYNQITKAEWVQSSDKEECFIGYTCKERDGSRFK